MQIFWLLAIVAVIAFVIYYLLSQKRSSGTALMEKQEVSDDIMEKSAEPPTLSETPLPTMPDESPKPAEPSIEPAEPEKPDEPEPSEAKNDSPFGQGMDININNE